MKYLIVIRISKSKVHAKKCVKHVSNKRIWCLDLIRRIFTPDVCFVEKFVKISKTKKHFNPWLF